MIRVFTSLSLPILVISTFVACGLDAQNTAKPTYANAEALNVVIEYTETTNANNYQESESTSVTIIEPA